MSRFDAEIEAKRKDLDEAIKRKIEFDSQKNRYSLRACFKHVYQSASFEDRISAFQVMEIISEGEHAQIIVEHLNHNTQWYFIDDDCRNRVTKSTAAISLCHEYVGGYGMLHDAASISEKEYKEIRDKVLATLGFMKVPEESITN